MVRARDRMGDQNLGDILRAEVQALTYSLRRRARHRAGALANDMLVTLGRAPRFEETLAEQWARVIANSRSILSSMPPAGNPRILFGAMFGGGLNRIMDSTLAMALRLRGASPVVLACDHGLSACEVNVFGNFAPSPGEFAPQRLRRGQLYGCQACSVKLAESHSGLGLPQVSLASYVRPEDAALGERVARGVSLAELRSVMHRDVAVGEHAYSTLLKATLRGDPPDDERTRFMARRYLASAVTLVEAGERVFDDIRPDHLVLPDGVYLTAGTLVALARKRGVHVVVHGAPFRKGTIWLYHGESYFRAFTSARTDGWSSLELTPERRRVADEYLAAKHFAARDYISYHVGSIQDEEAIRSELGLDGRPIVSVYTNVLWDAQLYYSYGAFRNMLDWLFETIEFYAARPDVQLVIRVHPGEARGAWPTNQPLVPEIERRFPTLPANVKLVLPESKVSSYVLGKMSKLALVYGARVGMELVMLGTPVIVAGESLIRGRGFTLDPASRDAYFELLEKSAAFPPPTVEVQEQARKWYYYYLFRMMMPFPFFYGDPAAKSGKYGLSFDSLDALLPGRSPVLDRVCQGIVDGVTPFEWDEFE
jgi:hypothetical protein